MTNDTDPCSVNDMDFEIDTLPNCPKQKSVEIALSDLNQNHSKDEKLNSNKLALSFNQTIFSSMMPFIFVGCPFNFCSVETNSTFFNRAVNSLAMKIYTFAVSIFAHLTLISWIIIIIVYLFTVEKIDSNFIEEFFIFSFILAGIIALDTIWYNRHSIKEMFLNIDFNPLLQVDKYRQIFLDEMNKLRYKRFNILLVLSNLFASLLVVYYGFVIYFIVESLMMANSINYQIWRSRLVVTISVYSFYFFISDALLLLATIWAIKLKIQHLNWFIKLLIDKRVHPEISDIELIKTWFQNIKRTTKIIDDSFALYVLVYIGFSFFAIIYIVSKTIHTLKSQSAESLQFLLFFSIALVITIIFFYGLKELTDVHEDSSSTKSILFEYVLNTKPEERSTEFFEEINFVSSGLLSNPATFHLLGQIELTKSFLARMAVVIYSYSIIFNQFTNNIN